MRLRRQSQRYYIVKDLQKPHPEKATLADMPELLDFLYGIFAANNPTHPRFEWLYPDMFPDEEKAGRLKGKLERAIRGTLLILF